jgi:hypothetical protein
LRLVACFNQFERILRFALVAGIGDGGKNKVVNWASRSCERFNNRAHAQKNILKPHRRQCWVIPPKANSAFVAASSRAGQPTLWPATLPAVMYVLPRSGISGL